MVVMNDDLDNNHVDLDDDSRDDLDDLDNDDDNM